MTPKASMTAQIQPPARWTIPTLGIGCCRQSTTSHAKDDIESAVKTILAENKYATDALSVSRITYTPPTGNAYTTIAVPIPCSAAGHVGLIVEDGSVVQRCPSTGTGAGAVIGPLMPINEKLVIELTAKIDVSKTQWDQMAAKLQEKLAQRSVGATFLEPLTVD